MGLEVAQAAALLGLAYAIHVVLIALAARGHPIGHLGNLVYGIGWAATAGLDHLDDILYESPYRDGFISKAFEVGIMGSALILALVSAMAWRAERQDTTERPELQELVSNIIETQQAEIDQMREWRQEWYGE